MTSKQTIQGQCLCGIVKFSLVGSRFSLYQCHCSECRKITGSNANASVIISEKNFSWLEGDNKIATYTHTSGYRSDFCASCGSPTPNKIKNIPYYWVPAGALDESENLKIKAHLCVASKATWEVQITDICRYNEVPDYEELFKILEVQ